MHLVLDPRPMPHDLVAAGDKSAQPFRGRVRRPDLRQVADCMQARQRRRIDLVGLDMRMGDRLHLQRIGDHHTSDVGCKHAGDRHAVSRRLYDNLVRLLQKLSAKPFQGGSGHIDPSFGPGYTVLPDHHLPEGPMDIYGNDTSHARLPCKWKCGSGGQHDNYGFALPAQPGESQRRPATNTSSQLIEWIGRPAPSCSRCLCPGCSQHTSRSQKPGERWHRDHHTGYQPDRTAERRDQAPHRCRRHLSQRRSHRPPRRCLAAGAE